MTTQDRAWAATRKGLFELRRRANGWQIENLSFVADPVSMLLPPDASGRMLAALNLGHFGTKLQASDDAGKTWHEVAVPAYPPQPEGAEGPEWKLLQIWSLERAGDTLWAGTIPGGLFASRDGAQSWQINEALWNEPKRLGWFGGGNDAPAMHSICPDPRNPGELLLGISCGGAWRTTDGGQTWGLRAKGMRADFMPPERAEDPNIQDPHCLTHCASQPDVLWVQHHCGLYRSSDGGERWDALPRARPTGFGFAVACDPHNPRRAWFVPAQADSCRIPVNGRMVVSRTDDGGASFQQFGDGLPQHHACHLVYRHALDVANDGQTLAMGSTTGGLWTSVHAGEDWHCVSRDLPPIAVVRFVG